jgi:hypothetical protein
MAFAVKYRLEIASIDGIPIKLDILENSYAGAVLPMKPANRESAIRYIKGERNGFKGKTIIPSSIIFAVTAETDFQYAALATIEEQELKVNYYENNVLQFTGWLLPDEYNEAYQDTPYTVTFTATDYISQLKDVPYVGTILNAFYGTRDTFMYFIKEALLKTGLELNIKENVNIYASIMDSAAADSPLTQGTIDPIIFYPENNRLDTYSALEFLIKNFRARIYQESGVWYIEQINEKQNASFIERTYNSAGVYQSQETVSNNLVKFTRPDLPITRRIKRSNPFLDNDRPFKDVSVYYQQTTAQGASVLRGFSQTADYVDASTLQDWTVSGTTIARQTVSLENDPFAVRINGSVSSFASAGYIESQAVSLLATAASEVIVRWKGRVNATAITTKRGVLRMELRLEATSSANVYYYYGGSWNLGANVFKYYDKRGFNSFNDFQVTTPTIPENGNLFIRFYQVQEIGAGVGAVQSVDLTGFVLDVFTEADQTTAWLVNRAFVAEKATFTSDREIILYADGPGPASPGAIRVGSNLTTVWARRGVTESRSLTEQFLQLTANLFQSNSWRFSGELLIRGGRSLKFNNTFADQDSVSTRKYYFGYYEYNPALGELAYEGIQFIAGDRAVTFEQFTRDSIERLRWDIDFGLQIPINPFPGVIPEIPTFTIPDLNGDIIGGITGNLATPQLIKSKPVISLTGIDSSNVVLNTTVDNNEDSDLSKITAKSLISSWPDKATPIAADKIPILDSVTGEIRMATADSLPIAGSKWTEVTNGIYRNGRVAIGKNTVGTTSALDVSGLFTVTRNTFPVFNIIRELPSGTASTYATGIFSLNRTGGNANNYGPAVSFEGTAGTSDFYAAVGAIRTGAVQGNLIFQCWEAGTTGYNVEILANGGMYLGRKTGTDTLTRPTTEANSLQVAGRLLTGNFTGTTARYWKLGERKAATTTLDTTQYITVEVNGVVYNLALATV